MFSIPRILVSTVLLSAGVLAAVPPLAAQNSIRLDGTWVGQSPLERQLAARVSLSFAELSLDELAGLLRERYTLNVKLDLRALRDVGLNGGTKVPAFEASNVVLEEALYCILKEIDVTILASTDVLQITTPEEAENVLDTRIYPVADLVVVGRMARKASGGFVANDPYEYDFDSLMYNITSSIDPDSWDEVGGAGSIEACLASRSLVISQTRDVHRLIGLLLDALRKAKTVSERTIAAGLVNHRGVGSRPYTPNSAARSAAARRPSRYVYHPRGTWHTPQLPD